MSRLFVPAICKSPSGDVDAIADGRASVESDAPAICWVVVFTQALDSASIADPDDQTAGVKDITSPSAATMSA